MSVTILGGPSFTLDGSGITVDRSVEVPGTSMIAALVEFLKDPVRLLNSLYSWLGWPLSTLGVAAVWRAERPSETLVRIPWFRGGEWRQDEGFEALLHLVGVIGDPAQLVLVSILVLVVLAGVVLTVLECVHAHVDDSIVDEDLIDRVVDGWPSTTLANVFGSLIVGLAMMLLSAPFEPLARPLRILRYCLGLEEVQRTVPY